MVRKEKRNRVAGLVKWVASTIFIAVANAGASVWKYSTKPGQGFEECGQLRVCLISLEEAKLDSAISFTIEADGGNTTKISNHLLKCHKRVVAENRELKAKESIKRGNTLENYLGNSSMFLSSYVG